MRAGHPKESQLQRQGEQKEMKKAPWRGKPGGGVSFGERQEDNTVKLYSVPTIECKLHEGQGYFVLLFTTTKHMLRIIHWKWEIMVALVSVLANLGGDKSKITG